MPSTSNLLASLFGAQQVVRDAEPPILKSHGIANEASREAAFGSIGGGANAGGGTVASGDSGTAGRASGGTQSGGTSGTAVSLDPSAGGTTPQGDTSGQASSGTPTPTADTSTSTEAGLLLEDAAGNAVDVALDANTIVISAATWCSACAQFKQILMDPGAMAQIEGVRLVFAFGDEGGTGPGGVLHEEFLANLPGDVFFLGAGSVQPESFPNAFNAATGQFDQHPTDAIQDWWLANTPQGQAAAAAGGVAGVGAERSPRQAQNQGLGLVGANGNALDVPLDDNTLVIGAATWCGATKGLVAALKDPEISARLEGLRLVFAFDNEGGDGPGGVLNPEFLDNLPGEVAFFSPGSVRPERLPMAYNPASDGFDLTAVDALNAWASGTLVTGGTCGNKNPAPDPTTVATGGLPVGANDTTIGSGSGETCSLVGDYNGDCVVNAADYTVWRDTFGSQGSGLAADGNPDERIDELDYQVWTANFNNAQLPGAFSITGPPSPDTDGDFTVTWSPSADASSYQFVLSQMSNCSSPLINENLTTTSKEFSNIGESTLYICVTAINAAGSTPASNSPYQLVVDIPEVDQTVFVTSTNYSVDDINSIPPLAGTFGSAAAADYHCTDLADQAGLLEDWDGSTSYFRAMLAVAFVDLTIRADVGNDNFVNVNGSVIATSRSQLYSGAFLAPILTQSGQTVVGSVPVWTGSNASGMWTNFTCSDWMDPFAAAGTIGTLNSAGSAWLSNGTRACNLGARLYCIGVRQTPLE